MTSTPSSHGQWPVIASTWHLIGPPLRPGVDDLALVQTAVDDWISGASRPPRVLILGVTPELLALPWPSGTVVRAVDRSEQMIDNVWPGDRGDAVHADWRDLPWPDDSFDLVLCDGGWHLLDIDGQRELARTLARIIAPNGRFVVRLFVPPERRESPDTVTSDLLAGRIRDLNRLKLRLGMALMTTAEEGVELQRVWRHLRGVAGSWEDLAARLGWDLDHLRAIDAYRDSPARYHFVTVDQFEETMRADAAGFETQAIDTPGYPMGDQCPTVVLRRLP